MKSQNEKPATNTIKSVVFGHGQGSANEQFLWVDINGYVFDSGADFTAAEKLNTYPCKVYRTHPVSDLLV